MDFNSGDQGKLVPQDPNDEPASELLEVIQIAKNKLVVEGKFKSLESSSINKTDPTLFEIPKNWTWCCLDDIAAIARGGAQPNLNVGKIKETLIPLPPLAEQGRIVDKIDRLMGMCDRLEGSIESGKDKQTDLLNALMSQV